MTRPDYFFATALHTPQTPHREVRPGTGKVPLSPDSNRHFSPNLHDGHVADPWWFVSVKSEPLTPWIAHMYDDSHDNLADGWNAPDWLAERERERLENVAVYERRFESGCDLWTGQPLTAAANQLIRTRLAAEVCSKRRREACSD
jgi:hypothetical protein